MPLPTEIKATIELQDRPQVDSRPDGYLDDPEPYSDVELRKIISIFELYTSRAPDSPENVQRNLSILKQRALRFRNYIVMLYEHNLLSLEETQRYLLEIKELISSIDNELTQKEEVKKPTNKEELKYSVVRALIITSDKKIIMQQRPAWATLAPKKLTLPGGKIELNPPETLIKILEGQPLPSHQASQLASAIATMLPENILRELGEELGINPEDITEQTFSHFTVTKNQDGSLNYTAFYLIKINPTADELVKRAETAKAQKENEGLTFISLNDVDNMLNESNTAFGYEKEIKKCLDKPTSD